MSITPLRYVCRRPTLTGLSCLATRFADIWTCRSSNFCGCSVGTARVRGAHHHAAQELPAAASEDVIVPCRSNGEITLNIFHPHDREDPTSPLILYLPTAPHAAETFGVHDEQIIAALSASSNGTIVQVNYRAGDGVRYPTPVHDVLAGYDYVKERFRAHSWTTGSGRVQKASLHVGVCGQLVGGSLAAMLGLTESHLTQDRIAAVAINSPIADWIFPERQQTIDDVFKQVTTNQQDENERKPRTRRKKSAPSSTWEAYGDSSPASTRSLETLRRSLFKMPANYFDPFASPVHLFRSPTANVPSDLKDGDDTAELLMAQAKPRKAHRTFPPSNSTLVLPHIRLSTGAHNPLADSNEEFVKLLRRSVVRTALSRSNTQALLDRFEEEPTEEDDRLEEAISEAERRVEYHIGEGSGLWGTERKEQWVVDVENVGRWFRSIER